MTAKCKPIRSSSTPIPDQYEPPYETDYNGHQGNIQNDKHCVE